MEAFFISTKDCSVVRADKVFTFWQISDIHLDVFYSSHGNPKSWCHNHNNNNNNSNNDNNIYNNNNNKSFDGDSKSILGKFGDFRCEANWDLVTSAFELMKRENPDPGLTKKSLLKFEDKLRRKGIFSLSCLALIMFLRKLLK
jgi:hypothetical protein